MKRAVAEVMDIKTGQMIAASAVFARHEAEIFKLRRDLRERRHAPQNEFTTPELVCSHCTQPVYIAGNQNGTFYFKHFAEGGECPFKVKGFSPEQINAMRYNGAKESARHIELKNHIAKALENDPRFSKPKVEMTIREQTGISKEWRRPDISTEFRGKPLVFEIQLSTTFQDVIIQREDFYRRKGIYIIWVFDRFSERGTLFTEKDIYYLNKRNAFAISHESQELTQARKELVLMCHYQMPKKTRSGEIVSSWMAEPITCDDLTFSEVDYKVYFYDFDQAVRQLQARNISDEFEAFWLSKPGENEDCTQWNAEFERWWYYFIQEGLVKPGQRQTFGISRLMDALYSLRHKRIIGYNYGPDRWIQVCNQIIGSYPHYTDVLVKGLRSFDMMKTLKAQDKKGTFTKKAQEIHRRMNEGEAKYAQDPQFNILLNTLFPELGLLNTV